MVLRLLLLQTPNNKTQSDETSQDKIQRQHAEPEQRSLKRLQVCDAERHAEAETMKLLRSFGSASQGKLTAYLLGQNYCITTEVTNR